MSRVARGRAVKSPPGLHPIFQASLDDYVQALAWSPGGTQLAAAAIGGPISLYNGLEGSLAYLLPGHSFGTAALSWSRDSTLIGSCGQDGKLRIWESATGAARHILDGGASWVERVAWSPSGHLLASAAGRTVRLWNEAGRLLHSWSDHPATVADIAWSPDGRMLAAASYGGLTLWSPASAAPLRRYEWKGSTLVIAWSPSGQVIATGDQDATVHFWYVQSGKDLQMWGYPTKVRELAWDSTSRYLATGGGTNITVWDCAGPKGPEDTRPLELEGHELAVSALAYQPGGQLLASGGQDGRLIVWHPGRQRRPLAGLQLDSRVVQLAWSPDNQRLAVGCESGALLVFGWP